MKHMFISPAGGAYGSERSMLALLRARDFDAEVICPGGGALEEELYKLGVPVHPLEFGKYAFKKNPLWHYKFYYSVARILKAARPTTVVINLDGNTALVSLAAAHLGFPIVRFCRFQFQPPRRLIEQWTWKLPKAIICPSEDVASGIRNWHTPRGRKQVHCLYDPYDGVRACAADVAAFRAKLGIGSSRVIGYVGRLHPKKRVEVAIEAFGVVNERFPDLTLLIVGDSDGSPDGAAYRSQLVSLAAELGIAGQVKFLGYVPQLEMPTIMATLATCILPSESESFGMVLVEAWAQGVPTLASDVGGCAEITRASGGGCLAPVDAIESFATSLSNLLARPSYAAQLGSSGADWVASHCRSDKYVARFSSVITDVQRRSEK